jgi:hypothetical protein
MSWDAIDHAVDRANYELDPSGWRAARMIRWVDVHLPEPVTACLTCGRASVPETCLQCERDAALAPLHLPQWSSWAHVDRLIHDASVAVDPTYPATQEWLTADWS